MKGTLKNKESKWVVEYEDKPIYPGSKDNFWKNGEIKELPLHSDDVKQLETGFTDKFTKEVEFEIVEYNKPGSSYNNYSQNKYAKLIKL